MPDALVRMDSRIAVGDLTFDLGIKLASDVFVMLSSPTSTGDVEGFGIAIIEANALSLPSIGAKDCGIEDALEIRDGIYGILSDTKRSTRCIHLFITNPCRLNQ